MTNLGRAVAGILMCGVIVAFFAGYADREGFEFVFIVAAVLLLADISHKLDQLRRHKDSPILEYTVKTMALKDEFGDFEVWLESLNNERWELVTILASPVYDGLFYGIFARPSKIPLDR